MRHSQDAAHFAVTEFEVEAQIFASKVFDEVHELVEPARAQWSCF